MTSYDPFDPRPRPQPPPEQRQGAGVACSADNLRQTLHDIAGQIGDADRRHSDALRDMQGRLARLSGQFQRARDESASGRRAAATRLAEPDPLQVWDAQAAEALTRLYESGDGDARRWPEDRPRSRMRPAAAAQAAVEPNPVPPPAAHADRAWLEERLGDIARRLQQSLCEIDPARSLPALSERIDRFEQHVDAAIQDVASRVDVERLKAVEAHVGELAARVDHSQDLLARLDTIDARIGELAEHLDEAQHRPAAAPGLSEEAAESLADAAAERAAARVVASLPAPPPPDTRTGPRLDGLETLFNEYIAERRQSEEQTAGVLQAIEEALAHIGDRVEALEVPGPALLPAEAAGYTDPFLNGDPLVAAYAEGRRALAPRLYGQTLDASDYVAASVAVAGDVPLPVTPAAEPEPATDAPAAGEGWPRDEFSASAIRERLKAHTQIQVTPDAEPRIETGAPPRRRSPRRAPKPSTATGENARLGLLIAVGVALLVCAGYLIFDAISDRQSGQRGARLMRQGSLPQASMASTFSVVPLVEAAGVARAHAAEVEPPHPAATAPPPRTTGAIAPVPAEKSPTHAGRMIPLAGPLAAALSARIDPGAPPAGTATLTRLPPTIAPASVRQAAEKGDPAAAFQIGARFAEGRAAPQNFASAFVWYRRAALKGHVEAQYRLAVLYEHGAGVGADVRQAKHWYERAAAQGHVTSMYNLAVLEAGPNAGTPDYAAAVRWFKEAAARGLADSQFNLGVLYEKGRPGVPKDAREAFKWFALAARSGDKEAARRVEHIAQHLPPATVADLEEKVAAWQQVRSIDARARACPGCG